MRGAKVIKGTGLRESEFVDRANTGEDPLVAVHIIRRTKLFVRYARVAAGHTVPASAPSPSNGVTDGDVHCRRRERETVLSHSYIENLTAA